MRTVLITGGSRGIGAECVRRFAEAGDRVAFLYRNNDEAAKAVESETGAFAVRCDVSDSEAVKCAFEQIHTTFGRGIDVLVNNAGISQFKLFQDLSDEDWNRMIGVHLNGTFYCTRAALPSMISNKRGCVINLSSMWGQVGASCETAYSAAKAGVIGLTKALAQEVGPSGIRVNCVAPGVIETEMNASLTPQTMRELEEQTPLCRVGTPRDVAETVFFLASDAATFITGQVIGVNGGFVI